MQSTAITRTNLVSNPSFEVDTSGWTTYEGTLSRQTSDKYVGTASAEFVVGTSGGVAISPSINTVSGLFYSLQARVKGTAGDVIFIQGHSSSGGNGYTQITADGTWQLLDTVFTCTTSSIELQLGSYTASHSFLIDAVLAEQGPSLESYFDGSFGNGYSWSGTPNDSISYYSQFEAATFSLSRNISSSVLVSWDKSTASGINYFTIGTSIIGGSDIIKTTAGGTIAAANQYNYDVIPASGVVGWSTSIGLTQFPFGLVQRQADVTLSNASADYLPASGTSLGPDIDIGRPVIIQAGFGAETIPLFTGYSDTPVNDISARTVSLHCYDATDYLNSFTSINTPPLQNLSADAIIEKLLEEAGFDSQQYVLEGSLNPTIPYLDPYGQIIGNVINDLCVAEGAIFVADESGILHFWNRQHFSADATPVATLTYSNMVDLQLQNGPLLNSVEATSNPLQVVSGSQQVYSLQEAYYLQANGSYAQNQITNPSFEVSVSGWGGNLSRTSAQAYIGSYSASGTKATYDLSSTASSSPDGIGNTVGFRAQVKPTAGTVTFSLIGGPVNNAVITGTTSQTVSGTGWSLISLEGNHYSINALGGVTDWSIMGLLPTWLCDFSVTTLSGTVYTVGGWTGSQYWGGTFYGPATKPSTLSTTASLPTPLGWNGVVTVDNHIYSIGGNGTSGQEYSDVWYATPLSDGSISSWSATASMPQGLWDVSACTYSGTIYVLGGWTGTKAVTDVIYAQPNGDGSIDSWTSTTALPVATEGASAIAYNGYIYLIGGDNDTDAFSTVRYAPINADGTLGSWNSTTSFPYALTNASAVVANGFIYVLGGWTSPYGTGTVYASVYAAPINANGTLGSWTETASLKQAVATAGAYVVGNTLYLLGGQDNTNSYRDIQTANFLSSGVTVSGSGQSNFYLDAVSTDVDDQYFDGNTDSSQLYAYDWDGTRGLSSSSRTPIPHYLNLQAPLNYSTYSLVQPVASGLNYSNIGPEQSFYSFSSSPGIGGIFSEDLTANVSLLGYSVSGTTAFLSFQNNSSQQAYLTNLVLFGAVAKPSTLAITQSYFNTDSVNKYRLNPANNGLLYTINNDYISTPSAAQALCEWVVDSFSSPYLQFSPTNFAIPNLQFGDCVELVNRDTGETRQGYVFSISNAMSQGAVFTQQLVIQERPLQPYFTIGTSIIGSTDAIAP